MQIIVDDDIVQIKFNIVEKILGVHGSFVIPLNNISFIHTDVPKQSFKELRIPGTCFPGLIKAGTYFTNRGWEFWYTTRNNSFLNIELKNGFYKRIILSFNENESIKNKVHDKIRPNN